MKKKYWGEIHLIIITKPIEADSKKEAERIFREDVNYIDDKTVDDVPSIEVYEVKRARK